ncbi:hypothetical protein [Levilactobacillus huananensis]|uniref:hypothetical protein n=1 Tax=Levilactobacillus huananensis TaxID=2486019 RepID=UPI000F7A7AF6|nr:hypothetical protein [Levilactobacillus huananensis]
MRHEKTRKQLQIWLAILGVILTLGLGAAVTKADAAKVPSQQKLRTDKSYYIKKNKKALRAATLNKKGLSIAWKEVVSHKIKLLKRLKKVVAQERGTVYTSKQAKVLTRKINKLNKKYVIKLKKLKAQRVPADIEHNYYIFPNGDIAFMQEKVKQVGNTTYVLHGLHELNGVFHKFGGHGAGFTVRN